jgi:hypothetical protein
MWPGAVIYAGSSSSLHDAGGLVFCPWPIGSVRCLFDNFFLAGCFAVATSAAVQRISLVGHRILADEGHATARESTSRLTRQGDDCEDVAACWHSMNHHDASVGVPDDSSLPFGGLAGVREALVVFTAKRR